MDWHSYFADSVGESAPQLPLQLRLPAVPESVSRYTLLADDSQTRMEELVRAIESDPNSAAELLRHVNSATFGMTDKVRSLQRAIVVLGVRRTRTLLMMTALRQALGQAKSPLQEARHFHQECIERALFAREMSTSLNVDGETAYSAGLIQDLLLPVLTETFPDEYRSFLNRGLPLHECEQECFGWDHAQLMARVMIEWGFPEDLIACVRLHHQFDRVHADEALAATAAGAVTAAALLPDGLCQEPFGLDRLFRLQEEMPKFLVLDTAARVDDAADRDCPTGARSSLCDRLGRHLMERLERERVRSIEADQQVGNYRLIKKLGEGGMGVVYRAQHSLLKRPCAIKLLNSARLSRRAIERFEREVQLTSQLTSPQTIGIYDFGITGAGIFYYVMEYIDGINLTHLVQASGPVSEARTTHILKQVCASLSEAHACGLIHRDIKPDNIMLTCRGGIPDVVKVLDFGLARAIEQTPGEMLAERLAGTPHYMAPEAILTPHEIDVRTDLYALGAVGYFLLSGCNLFEGSDLKEILRQQVEEHPVRLSVRRGAPVNERLERLIHRCLSKSPQDRPLNAGAVARELELCENSGAWDQRDAAAWWGEFRGTNPDDSMSDTRQTEQTLIVCT